MSENNSIGEVVMVESLTRFLIQQVKGEDEVRMGRFVMTERNKIFGVLGDISIQNPDFGMYPRPKNLPDNMELSSIYPDLVDQFPTIITVYVLGYFNNERVEQSIPLRPPQIYDKVRLATQDEIKTFHNMDDFDVPRLEYLIRLQEFEQSAILDTLLRNVFAQLASLFDIDAEEIMDVLS